MASDDLKIKIGLEVDNNVDTSKVKKNAEKAGQEIGENVNKGMATSIAKGMAIRDTIKGAIQKVWNMTKQFLSDSVNLANSYESAFAGVKKTVDGTTKDFQKLNNSLKNLAKEVPMTYKDLAGIMELGGQLGVQTKDLDKFTKTIAELGTATNLTSENAAQMLAQFANITKMDLNDIDKLGSVVVDLGNNFATTEADIVNFAQRIAGAGQIAGISQANIMAIATAFSSVGIEAEAGGTAVQKVLLDMNSAVNMGGDQLEKYAKIIGVTTDEFKKLYNEHPEQVFTEFIKSLQGAGQEAQALLSALGLDDQRLVRSFLSLSQNADLLTDAIDRSNTAWSDNIALSNEAEQRFSTTESQMIMQQNERANMMAAIGEKLQDVVLIWETVKTTFVNAIGSFLGITQESNEATEALKAQIEEVIGAMNDLDKELHDGKITLEEWVQQRMAMKKQAEEMEKALEQEEKRLEKLSDSVKEATGYMAYYSNRYEFLMENKEKYSATWEQEAARMKQYYENWAAELERLQIVQEAGIALTDEEIDRRIKQKQYTEKLTQAENDLKAAKEEYNALKSDDSTTRSELEKSRQKVIQLTKAYNDLKNSMASVGIAKTFKNVINKGKQIINKIKDDLTAQIENAAGGGGSGSEDDGGVLGDLTLGGSGSGGGKNSSKATDMLKEYEKEMTNAYNSIGGLLDDHQKNYDKLKESIEKVENEYAKLRSEATKTRREAKRAIEDYNKELEETQADSMEKLGQRYVELREQRAEIDNDYLKKRIGEISEKERQNIRDEGWTWRGYGYDELKDIYELYKEMKLIEDNTTEEQRQAKEFTEKTSKAQEILNELKEKEAEIEEKKAAALERQAIAEAQRYTFAGQQRIKVIEQADGTLKGMYEDREGVRQEIHDLDNLEYAKQLSDQVENLGSQLEEFTTEKNNEVEILITVTAKKKELEEEYTKIFQKQAEARKKSLDEEIARVDTLIRKKQEYLSMSVGNSARAYGGELNKGVTLVGENGPEAIVRRQASYVQPRNAVQNYSTVTNNNSSLSINGLELGYNSVDEMLADFKSRLTYRS